LHPILGMPSNKEGLAQDAATELKRSRGLTLIGNSRKVVSLGRQVCQVRQCTSAYIKNARSIN
jgi:hypothetical protein